MRMVPFFLCKNNGALLKTEPEIMGCNIDGKMTLPNGKGCVVVQEKVQYKADGVKLQLKFWETFGKENTDQSKARRELAKATFYVYFFLILSGAVVYKFDPAYAIYLFKIVESLTWLVGMIGAAYFVPHQVSKIYQKK